MTNIIGKVLLEQFRVDAFIASGGMGSVYRVWDLKRSVPLAMKTLNADLAEDEHVFKLFEREARALKKLAHPNIVSFYGLFQTPEFAFLLEQYVDGPSLNDILKQNRGQPLNFTQAMIYLKAIASALGYAHANGVVHCDVKPGNVLVDRGGGVFLTDFGIARHVDSTTTTLGTMGTAAYMAPEQIRGEPVAPATDVYALGVVLFELFTGQRPFKGTEVGDDSGATANERIRAAHLRVPAPDARAANPNVPAALAAVIQKAMSKPREARYQNANDLLTAACAALGIGVDAIPVRVSAPSGLYEQAAAPAGAAKRPKTTPAFWIGALLVIMVVIGGIFSISRGAQPTLPPSTRNIFPTDVPSHPTEEPPTEEVTSPTDEPQQVEPATVKPQPTARPRPTQFSCPGAPHPVRFKVNQSIYVCTKNDKLALHPKPADDNRTWLSPGSHLTIIAGPRCAEANIWWRVQTESGEMGWVMDGTDAIDKNYICAMP
ncbi:MAG: protein kinase [Anaerolineales bacterium]